MIEDELKGEAEFKDIRMLTLNFEKNLSPNKRVVFEIYRIADIEGTFASSGILPTVIKMEKRDSERVTEHTYLVDPNIGICYSHLCMEFEGDEPGVEVAHDTNLCALLEYKHVILEFLDSQDENEMLRGVRGALDSYA